jgi:hypothetical protein
MLTKAKCQYFEFSKHLFGIFENQQQQYNILLLFECLFLKIKKQILKKFEIPQIFVSLNILI